MIRNRTIRLGRYELACNSRGEPVLTGVRGIGQLSYSAEHAHAGAFRLFMPLPSRYGHTVDAADFANVHSKSTPHRLTVHYQKPVVNGVAYDIGVVCRVSLNAQRDALEISVAVQNNCPHVIKEVRVTGFEGLVLLNGVDRISLRHTSCSVEDLLRSPVNLGWEFYTPGREYLLLPPGLSSMPFAIFDAGKASLYLCPHDEQKREGAPLIVRNPGRNVSAYLPPGTKPELSCYYLYRVHLKTGEEIALGNVALAMAAGDWHAFRAIYRRWHLRHFPLRPRHPALERYDGWQHKALLLNDGRLWNRFEELPGLYRKLNEATGLTCLMIYGHTEEGADLSEPDVEPAAKAGGLRAFQKALAEIHAMGGKVFVMTKMNRASTRAPEWKKRWHKSVITDEWGVEQYVGWQIECGWESGNRGRPNGRMCLYDRDWRDFIARRLSRLAQIGVDGIQLDESCDRSVCHSPNHDHKDPAGEYHLGLGQTLAQIRRECRKYNRRMIIGGEELTDSDFHWLEFSYSRWSCRNSDTGVTNGRIFRYYLPEAITHTRAQSFEIDQINYALLLGTPIDVEVDGLRTMIYEHPLELRYVQSMLDLRRKHGRFFYDGTYVDTEGFKLHSDKPVHYASHRARNGDGLLVVINRSDDTAAVRIEPETRYARFRILAGYGRPVRETRTLSRGHRVRPHDVLVLECLCEEVGSRLDKRQPETMSG